MLKQFLLFLFLLSFLSPSFAQEETAEEFIIAFTSNYKNPLAYYPLRQDIFLPGEDELEELESRKDRPSNATVMGSFVFLNKNEALNRDRFVTASGELIYPRSVYRGLSERSSFKYHKRRRKLLLSNNANLGKFLWYNQQFKNIR